MAGLTETQTSQQQIWIRMADNPQANRASASGGGNLSVDGSHRRGTEGGNPGGDPGGNPGGNPDGNPGSNPYGNPQVRPQLLNQQRILFVDNPFAGDINPGTPEGAKLYMKGTAQIDNDDKFDITIDNAQRFLNRMSRDTNTFGWGVLVRHLHVGPNEFKNILVDHKDITKEDIKHQAYRNWVYFFTTYQDPVLLGYNLQIIDPGQHVDHVQTFYRCVTSRMIARRIIGYSKAIDYEVLKNKSSIFTWSGQGDEEVDGLTFLWILLQMCNPFTRVGVAELKDDLRKATSAKFQHNMKTLMDYMSLKYRNIQEKGQTHEDYV